MANLRISEEQLRELIYEYQKTKDKKVAVRINCVIAWDYNGPRKLDRVIRCI